MFLIIILTKAIVLIITILSILQLHKYQKQWMKETSSLNTYLINESVIHLPNNEDKCIFSGNFLNGNNFPPALANYLTKVLQNTNSTPGTNVTCKKAPFRYVTVKQKGLFLLDDNWIPFTARTVSSISPPSFVWDARMRYMGIPIQVRDMYLSRKGRMEASLFGVINIVNVSDRPDVNDGELMRWLAEIPLYPSAFLIHNEIQKWKFVSNESSSPDQEKKVSAELQMQSHKIMVDFYFDENTNLISRVYAMRPKLNGTESILSPWEGFMYDYNEFNGIIVPTRMEVGWWEEEMLKLYFKGYNTDFDFQDE